MKIWFNNKIVDEKDAMISVKAHGLHYGTAVFEGIRFYETEKGVAIFRLKDHIDRLFHSADALKMSVTFSRNDIKNGVKELIKSNNLKKGYIRIIIFYGPESLAVYPENISVNCAIILDEIRINKEGLRLKTSKFRKISDKATVHGTKISGFYANSVLAMEDVRKQGFDEALMLDQNGFVSEGPAYDFFIVKDNLITTPSSKSALLGITRSTILKIAKDLGYESIEKELTIEEATDADEAFFCSTGSEIIWIKEIDHIKISENIGDITTKIKDKFNYIVHGKDEQYLSWLEIIE